MTSGSHSPEGDVGRRLRELDATNVPDEDELMDRMFVELQSRCDKDDRSVTGFLRSRSTMTRRLIVLSVFSLLAIMGWFAFPLVGDQARTAPWTVSLVTFVVLLLLAMLMVTRPVHLPALPRWQSVCLVCIALGATIVAAVWPYPTAMAVTHSHGGEMAGACL
ncbi:MAG: hypothetical protein WCF10_18095, partial [Polyangiales bacterium]